MLSVIMLNVTYKPFVLSVIMQSAVRLNVVMLSVAAPFVNASHLYFVRKLRTPLGLAPNLLVNIRLRSK